MLTQALIAAAGTVTPTPAPDPEAGNNFSLAAITRDAETIWPRVFPPTVTSYSGTYHQLGHLVYDWEHNTRFWLHHTNNNTIRQYDLPYPGFVSNVLTTTTQLSLSSVDSEAKTFTFGASGAKLYVVGRYYLYEFDLSTAYNVSTANLIRSLDMRSLTVINDTNPSMFSLQFNYTGRRMYLGCRFYNEGSTWVYGVLQFSLTTAWDISTAVWDGNNTTPRLQLSGIGQITTPTQVRSVNISHDGTKIFAVVGSRSYTGSGVGRWWFYQINLADSNKFGYSGDVFKIDFNFANSYVNPDQTRAYFVGTGYIRQYNFGSVGQANTLGYGGAVNVGTGSIINERFPECVALSYDGTRAYLGASDQNRIYCLRLSSPWEIATAEWRGANAISYISLKKIESGIMGVYWSPDGYQLYILGIYSGGRRFLRQLTVDQPYTFSGLRETARRAINYSNAITFSPSGTVMLLCSTMADYIYSYSGSPYSPMSMSYITRFFVTNPYCAAFHGYGGTMWVSRGTIIYEYRLRSSFNIEKAVYTGYRYLAGTTVRCMQFSPDGHSLFINVYNATGGMRQLFLSTPWDLRSVYARYDINLKPMSRDWQLVSGNYVWSFHVNHSGDVLTIQNNDEIVFKFKMRQNWTLSSVYYDSGAPDFISTATTSYITTLYNIKSIAFSPDGRRMYAAQSSTTEGGRFGSDGAKIIQYNLSDPWELNNVGVASTLYLTSNFGTQAGFCMDIAVDGSYILVGYENQITRIPLSNPYELNSAQTVLRTGFAGSWTYSSSETASDVYIRPDGTKLFLSSPSRNSVTEYDIPTAFQVHTARLPASNYVKGFSNIRNCKFNAGGNAAYLMHDTNLVSRVELGSTWNIATATVLTPFYGSPSRGRGWDTYNNSNSYSAFTFGASGSRLFVALTDGNYMRINNYDCNGAYNINQPRFLFSWTPNEATLKSFRFRSDGFAIYVVSWSNRYGPARIIEYATNTAWTARHVPSAGYTTTQIRTFNTAPETLPRSVVVRQDGRQMWILGASRRTIRAYRLVVPFDISSAVLEFELGIAADRGGSYPADMIFSTLGKKFLIAETAPTSVTTGGAIHEYRCTRSFDISSAEWVRTYHYGNISHKTRLGGIDVNQDGTKLFTLGGDLLFSFTLTDS